MGAASSIVKNLNIAHDNCTLDNMGSDMAPILPYSGYDKMNLGTVREAVIAAIKD